MKLYTLNGPDDVQEVAERMWEIVQEHKPLLRYCMEKAVADEQVDRDDLMHLGFVFGVAFTLGEMSHGHIREANYG